MVNGWKKALLPGFLCILKKNLLLFAAFLRSNMYLAYSEVKKGQYFVGMRKKGRGIMKKMTYKYSNYIVCLVEGEASKDFYPHDHEDGNWKMENRLRELRSRTIPWDFKFDRPHAEMKRS